MSTNLRRYGHSSWINIFVFIVFGFAQSLELERGRYEIAHMKVRYDYFESWFNTLSLQPSASETVGSENWESTPAHLY